LTDFSPTILGVGMPDRNYTLTSARYLILILSAKRCHVKKFFPSPSEYRNFSISIGQTNYLPSNGVITSLFQAFGFLGRQQSAPQALFIL
jgi:hypothetical protein